MHLEGVGVHTEVVPHAGLGADRKCNPGRLDYSLLEWVGWGGGGRVGEHNVDCEIIGF